jgi:sortase A
MIKVGLKHKDLFLLLLGGLLFIGGIVGIVFIYGGWGSNTKNQVPTPTAINVVLTPLQQEPTVVDHLLDPTESNATPQSTPVPKIEFPTINAEKLFVHAAANTGLEDPMIPDRIVIPSVGIDAKVVIADYNSTNIDGETFGQWQAPNEDAAGWQPDSALLGQIGNTVINGHHNEFGEAFGKLIDVKVGDKVYVYSQGKKYSFIIANRMILLERFVDTQTRLQNARWLSKTDDMRLTLVTCWPKFSNTHRLIVVARPLDSEE